MTIKELIERRAALLAELAKPETTAERFAEIRSEVEKLDYTIERAKKDADDAKREEELRAARKPNGGAPAPAKIIPHVLHQFIRSVSRQCGNCRKKKKSKSAQTPLKRAIKRRLNSAPFLLQK